MPLETPQPASSRRQFLFSATAAVAFGASGCVPDVLASGSVARTAVVPNPPGFDPSILAVTTRRPAKGALKAPWFGHERNAKPQFAQTVFHAPDGSLTGQAQAMWSGKWTVKSVSLHQGEMSEGLLPAVQDREILLYIHGYKESFESAATGAVELAQGIGFSGKTMLFSWPSKAALLDYGYDRESAMFSRDALEETLTLLLADGGAAKVHIVAHSMGTLLTIETLRQIWARQGDALAGRLGAVVLASPDIDLDLFTNALQRLRSLLPKITVISSTSDKALEVSRRLAGGVSRVGAASREQLEQLGVKVVDASDHGGWAVIKHDLFLTDPDVRQVVRRSIDRN
ncbi:MAG: alpha/beta hydrolase [Beijerinckiaceae bacterium]